MSEKEWQILYTIIDLEDFMERIKELCIQQANKGKTTNMMEKRVSSSCKQINGQGS